MRGTLKHLNLKFHWHEKVSVTPSNRLRSLTAFSVPLLPTALILMSDKGEEMEIAIFLLGKGQLKDLGFDDAVGIVLDAVLVKRQFIQFGFERLIKSFNQSKIARAFFHFRRLGRL